MSDPESARCSTPPLLNRAACYSRSSSACGWLTVSLREDVDVEAAAAIFLAALFRHIDEPTKMFGGKELNRWTTNASSRRCAILS